jgi:hypothetical protein
MRPEQARAGFGRPEQARAGQSRSEQARAGFGRPEQARAGQSRLWQAGRLFLEAEAGVTFTGRLFLEAEAGVTFTGRLFLEAEAGILIERRNLALSWWCLGGGDGGKTLSVTRKKNKTVMNTPTERYVKSFGWMYNKTVSCKKILIRSK